MEGVGDKFRAVAEEAEAEAVDDVDPTVAVGVPEVGTLAAVGDGREDHLFPEEVESGDGTGVSENVAVAGSEGFGVRVFGGVGSDQAGKMGLLGGSQATVLGAPDGLEGTEGDFFVVVGFECFDGDGVGGGRGVGGRGGC